MEDKRGVFTLNGMTGMLIATGLLLAILFVLVAKSIDVQSANATNFYDIKDPTAIKKIGSNASDHIVDVK
ncbi:MAG: DUF4006 family protein [Sulfuricurvum sp.]